MLQLILRKKSIAFYCLLHLHLRDRKFKTILPVVSHMQPLCRGRYTEAPPQLGDPTRGFDPRGSSASTEDQAPRRPRRARRPTPRRPGQPQGRYRGRPRRGRREGEGERRTVPGTGAGRRPARTVGTRRTRPPAGHRRRLPGG
jgi:hypothetical protein